MAACPLTRISRPSLPSPRMVRIWVTVLSTAFSWPRTGTDTTATLPFDERTVGDGEAIAPRSRASSRRLALSARAKSLDVRPEERKKTTSASGERPEGNRVSRSSARVESAPAGRNSVMRLDSTEPTRVANGIDAATTASQKATPIQLASRPVTRRARRAMCRSTRGLTVSTTR